jgi:hypothetical protein
MSEDSRSPIVSSPTPTAKPFFLDGDFEGTNTTLDPSKAKLGGARYDFKVLASIATKYSGWRGGAVIYNDNIGPYISMFG